MKFMQQTATKLYIHTYIQTFYLNQTIGQTYYEIHAINRDKAIGPNISYLIGNQMESNVRVCTALK